MLDHIIKMVFPPRPKRPILLIAEDGTATQSDAVYRRSGWAAHHDSSWHRLHADGTVTIRGSGPGSGAGTRFVRWRPGGTGAGTNTGTGTV